MMPPTRPATLVQLFTQTVLPAQDQAISHSAQPVSMGLIFSTPPASSVPATPLLAPQKSINSLVGQLSPSLTISVSVTKPIKCSSTPRPAPVSLALLLSQIVQFAGLQS